MTGFTAANVFVVAHRVSIVMMCLIIEQRNFFWYFATELSV